MRGAFSQNYHFCGIPQRKGCKLILLSQLSLCVCVCMCARARVRVHVCVCAHTPTPAATSTEVWRLKPISSILLQQKLFLK